MRNDNATNIDIEANLVCSAGIELKVSCKIKLPESGWDGAAVEIALPYDARVLDLEDPCDLTGLDMFGRTITLEGIFSNGVTYRLGREAGVVPLDIAHIAELRIRGRAQSTPSARNLVLTLAANEFLVDLDVQQRTVTETGHTEQILDLTLPHLGPVTFSRVWEFVRSQDRLNATSKCIFQVIVHTEDVLSDIANAENELRSALVVPSLLWRQRLSVLGWAETDQSGYRVQTWSQPLAPIVTESMGVPTGETLVHSSKMLELLPSTTEKFRALTPELQRLVEEIAMGLVPFVKQRHSQRFLSMFHALESCRKFAGKEPSVEVKADTEKLVLALDKVRSESEGSVAERLEGIIGSIHSGPKVDLKIQLQEVFQKWGVYTTDLWPLSGPEKSPGLKQIRDRLSHKGATALDGGCLVIATEHLTVLLERIVVALLELPLAETNINPVKLRRSHWFDPRVVLKERAQIFSSPDWA